ncbi:MAG: transposase, partial [Bifidobacteriaceae bacterium]|nr:transposase [Bifidobacteriaceae bacterium]
MQGFSRGVGGLFAVGEVAPGLVGPGTVYSFLAEHRLALFPEESFADLFPSGRGRPSTPGSVVAAMLLLQALEGLSDREAEERAGFDLRWKAALGLAVDEPAPDHTVLVYWRRRIAASADPDRVFRAVAQLVE